MNKVVLMGRLTRDPEVRYTQGEMAAKEIRQLKEPEEIPGQMKIQDYPEVLPEEKIPYFAFEGEPYGWTWSEVVKAYLKNGYEKPESGTEVKCLGEMYLALRRKEKTFFYDSQGNTLFEVDNKRLDGEYKYWQKQTMRKQQQEVQEEPQIEPVAPAQQIKGCIYRTKYNCTLTEEQKERTGDGNNCNEKCCWNCTKHGMCRYECIAFHRYS